MEGLGLSVGKSRAQKDSFTGAGAASLWWSFPKLGQLSGASIRGHKQMGNSGGSTSLYSTAMIILRKPRRTLFRLRASCRMRKRLTRVARARKMALISSRAKCWPTHM
jgi:hypothetical protein